MNDGEEEEEDGLLGCIQKECLISASQELYLQNCSFAGESDLVLEDSDDEFTPWTNSHTQLERIIMVSPPESPKDHEVFQTPPEGSIVDSSQEKEAAAAAAAPVESIAVRDGYVDSVAEEDDEYAEAVYLDRDSDNLGFSSVKLNQVSNHVSIDPGSKPREIETSIIKESVNNDDEEAEEASRKRSGSLLGEDRQLKRNGGEGTSSPKIVTDDIERFRYVSSSVVTQKRKEVSPVASIGRKANGVDVRQDRDAPPVIGNEIYKALLDTLQMITRKTNDGASSSASEEVDLLETAQRRGIVFPRPRWRQQPPEEEFEDD